MRSNYIWLALFLAGLLYELWTVLNVEPGDTLSENVRALIAAHGSLGNAMFVIGWIAFSVWFFFHILHDS